MCNKFKILIVVFLVINSISSIFANQTNFIGNPAYSKVTKIDTCESFVDIVYSNWKDDKFYLNNDYVLLIQMKGAEIIESNNEKFGELLKLNSAGLYEFGYISKTEKIDSFTKRVYFKKKIVNSYDVNHKVQLIQVPIFQNIILNENVISEEWTGDIGGVLAIKVLDTFDLDKYSLIANGSGFRGGKHTPLTQTNGFSEFVTHEAGLSGEKGESISLLKDSLKYGRGRSINGGGGGNGSNGGGGGASNVSFREKLKGGNGGDAYGFDWIGYGGIGGELLLPKLNYNRFFLGGGGGGGHTNEFNGGSGSDGGGIIIIDAKYIKSKGGKVSSNGLNAENAFLDGGGGGGAGGTVFINSTLLSNIEIEINGGNGGDSKDGIHMGSSTGGGGSIGKVFSQVKENGFTLKINANNGKTGITSNDGRTGFYPGKDAIGEELAAKDLDVIKELVVQSREKTKLSVKDTLATIYDICKFSSNSIILHAPTDNPNYNYKWNTGETSQSIKVTKPGIYESVITAGCDTYSRTYSVIGGKIEYRAELTPYEGKCGIDSMKITITPITDGVNFNWADGFTKLTRTFSKNGEFKLTLTKNNYCDSLITFNYRIGNGSFDSTFNNKNISYMSKARTFGSDIKMTDVEYFIKGSAWYNNKLSLRNNFSIDYSFSCSDGNNGGNDDGSLPGADGIVLVFQNNSIYELGLNGGGIGYQGIKNGLAFEIDLFKNTAPIYDVNGNHFAVQKSSKELGLLPDSSNSLFVNKDIIEIKENTRYYATMIYDASEKKINYYLDTVTPPNKLIMSKIINPLDYVVTIDGYSYFGFTSATGVAMQVYKIHDVKVCGTVQTTSVDWEEENLFEIDRIYSRIEVYNSIGKLVTTIENNNLLSSFNEVSKGIPLLIKITDKNVSFTKKIVAE